MNKIMYGMARAAWDWEGGNCFSDSLDRMDREMRQICTDRQQSATLWLANFFEENGDTHTASALRAVSRK